VLHHQVVDFLHEATGTEATVLFDEPNRGMTLFDRFEDAAALACFAVVLATPNNVGRARIANEDNDRARQNVILKRASSAGRLDRNSIWRERYGGQYRREPGDRAVSYSPQLRDVSRAQTPWAQYMSPLSGGWRRVGWRRLLVRPEPVRPGMRDEQACT
jgi:predicted nucleotide-binding protein with TIR-like domain